MSDYIQKLTRAGELKYFTVTLGNGQNDEISLFKKFKVKPLQRKLRTNTDDRIHFAVVTNESIEGCDLTEEEYEKFKEIKTGLETKDKKDKKSKRLGIRRSRSEEKVVEYLSIFPSDDNKELIMTLSISFLAQSLVVKIHVLVIKSILSTKITSNLTKYGHKNFIENWKLVELIFLTKQKILQNNFPEFNIEIRTCLFGSFSKKSTEFVFEKIYHPGSVFKNIDTRGLDIKLTNDPDNEKNNIISIKLKSNALLEIYLEFIENIIKNIMPFNDKKKIINLIIKK